MYEERFYRNQTFSKFKLEVAFRESDLLICTDKAVNKELAKNILIKHYREIEEYVEKNPHFQTSLSPLKEDKNAPAIINEMIKSSELTDVGPFASVAGAIALYLGREILNYADEVIVENGGDIFLKISEDKVLGVYLGERFKIKNLNLKIKKRDYAFGIASSSATIGHSLNFGKADLVTVIARNAIIADGFATSLSNKITEIDDVNGVLEKAKNEPSIEGMLVAFADKIFLWGELEIHN